MANVKWNPEKFKAQTKQKILQRLLRFAFMMATDIKKSMKGYGAYSPYVPGSVTKPVRGVRRTKSGKRHYPSPPGAPPAVDYGRLKASVSVNWSGSGMTNGKVEGKAKPQDGVGEPKVKNPDQIRVVVGTNIQEPMYPLYLELGTSKILPRPFLRPVFEAYKNRIIQSLKLP